MSTSSPFTNRLIHESSPYLLQHAHNPVDWWPFTDEALTMAKKLNKPMLISIGYSACHWCHVMEHESFEDPQVAEVMNAHFICIKVDREERPDVDHLYMQAVQLMTGHGGWPLNCFVLPDGKPFYGGTYFTKPQWTKILIQLADIWRNQPEKVIEYAMELTTGIRRAELISVSPDHVLESNRDLIKESVEKWKTRLDYEFGGPDKAPKFPLPNNYDFLLRYATLENDTHLLNHVHHTLQHMAFGGIYDPLHGGFARYSTDKMWKIPHFEKMLYDNAQLVELYTDAFVQTQNPLYQQVVEETLGFMLNHWKHPNHPCFFSATDADSEGEEGKFYVWTKDEIHAHLKEDAELFCEYFGIEQEGYWEHGNNVLMRTHHAAKVLTKHNLTHEKLQSKINHCKLILKNVALKRVPPGTDDKALTAWNALAVSAFAKAGFVFNQAAWVHQATQTIEFIVHQMRHHQGLYRTFKNGTAKIPGFLDDYAFTIKALIDLHQVTAEPKWLNIAHELYLYTLSNFSHDDQVCFYYTDSQFQSLVERTSEMSDNVIPASNSQMALNLFYLSVCFTKPEWQQRAMHMLSRVGNEIKNYGAGYSNWAKLSLHLHWPFKEIAIVGKDVEEKAKRLYQHGFVNTMFVLSKEQSDLPFLAHKPAQEQAKIHVCENGQCLMPVNNVEQAIQLIE